MCARGSGLPALRAFRGGKAGRQLGPRTGLHLRTGRASCLKQGRHCEAPSGAAAISATQDATNRDCRAVLAMTGSWKSSLRRRVPVADRRILARGLELLDETLRPSQFLVVTQSAMVNEATPPAGVPAVSAFIIRWQNSAASERANYALFLIELCDVLGVPRPEPAIGEAERDKYVFEHSVQFHNPDGSVSLGFIDLHRHNCFVLETKQGCEAQRGATLLE